MSSHAHPPHQTDLGHGPVPSAGILVGVAALIVVLTVITTLISHLELGVFNVIIAVLIALIRASVITWVFMGVRYTSNLTKLFVIGGMVWLAIMFFLTLSDYTTRNWNYQPQPWSTNKAAGTSR